MSLYYLGNYRTQEQLDDMIQLEAAGTCIFCPEHLAKDPTQRVLHRTTQWTITPNEFPYRGTRLHLLLVPDEHVTDMLDLSDEAQGRPVDRAGLGPGRVRADLLQSGRP